MKYDQAVLNRQSKSSAQNKHVKAGQLLYPQMVPHQVSQMAGDDANEKSLHFPTIERDEKYASASVKKRHGPADRKARRIRDYNASSVEPVGISNSASQHQDIRHSSLTHNMGQNDQYMNILDKPKNIFDQFKKPGTTAKRSKQMVANASALDNLAT